MSASNAGQALYRGVKRVLNAGSGPVDNQRLHSCFQPGLWEAVRLDIDPRVKPDLVGTITDMRGIVPDAAFDAIWCSHNLEHLHSHDVAPALNEFRRVLKGDGFAFITCPDLETVAALLLDHGMDQPIYMSPAGPVAVADMLFGHRASIAVGNDYMAHNTGFTTESLGSVLLEAGFEEVHVGRGAFYDLWAVACMPDTDIDEVAAMLSPTSQAFLVPR